MPAPSIAPHKPNAARQHTYLIPAAFTSKTCPPTRGCKPATPFVLLLVKLPNTELNLLHVIVHLAGHVVNTYKHTIGQYSPPLPSHTVHQDTHLSRSGQYTAPHTTQLLLKSCLAHIPLCQWWRRTHLLGSHQILNQGLIHPPTKHLSQEHNKVKYPLTTNFTSKCCTHLVLVITTHLLGDDTFTCMCSIPNAINMQSACSGGMR